MSDDVGLIATIQGKDINLRSLLIELRRDLLRTDQEATRAGRDIGHALDQGSGRGQAGVLRLQSAMARLDAQGGNTEGAMQRLRTTLNGITTSTPQTIAMEGQLLRLEQSAAKAATTIPKTSSALSGLAAAAGPAAVAFATGTLAAYGQEAIQLANRTKDAKAALEALAGTPQRYAEALATATQQQKLFGGSLEENISGIQGLITVARSSGAELSQLVDLAQRLSVKDPSQGIAGARTALNEALAGDPSSLARRYEIPKAALAALRDESTTTQQKLAVLDQYLNQIGITSETVAGSISQETQAFNALAASAEALQLKVGTELSAALTPAAQGATALFSAMATGEQANATLTALIVTLQQMTGTIQAGNAANIQATSGLLSFLGILTPAQQQLQAYTAAHAQTAQAVTAVASTYQLLSANAPEAAAGLQTMVPALQAVAAESDANAATVQALMDGLINETITIEQVRAALTDLQTAHQVNAQAAAAQASQTLLLTDQQTTLSAATVAVADSLTQEATQKAAASEQAAVLADINARLADLGDGVARGLFNAGDAAGFLAQQYGIATSAAYALVAAQVAVAAGEARLRAQAAQTRTLATPSAQAPGRRGTGDVDMALAGAKAAQAQAAADREAAAAQRRYQEAVGGARVELANARRDKAAAVVGSKAYYDALTAEAAAERRLAQEAKRGGAGGRGGRGRTGAATNPRVTDESQTAAQLARAAEQSAAQRETIERDHQDTMAQIAAEGAKKRQEAMARYSLDSKQDRASFYKQLGNVDDPQLRAQLSAQYEQIQQDAAKMAQEQGADVAQAYREAAIKAAQGQADIQQEIAQARKDGDVGKAEYLEGVAKLQAEADQAEIDSIKAKGSAISAEQARQYADAEAAYREHLDRLAQAYQEKVGSLGIPPASVATPPPASSRPSGSPPTTAPSTSTPAPVKDTTTSQAVDTTRTALSGDLSGVTAAVEKVERAVRDVISAVRSLKSVGTFKS